MVYIRIWAKTMIFLPNSQFCGFSGSSVVYQSTRIVPSSFVSGTIGRLGPRWTEARVNCCSRSARDIDFDNAVLVPTRDICVRAQRLRALTNNPALKSQSEIEQQSLRPRAIAIEALYRPFELMLLDPSIAFTAVYTAIVYGIFYSFFEAFPLVYETIYHFNLGELGLTFLSVTAAVIIATAWYWWYIRTIVNPSILSHGLGQPERRLIPALIVTFFVPIGLLIFAWTSRSDIHWIVSCIGIGITTIGIFLIIQCIFLYLPLSYPQYAASLFAGNDFTRSALAAASIHFSYPMFRNLGVDRGITLLAGLTVGCSAGVYVLYFYGERLRAKSRFAAK